MHRNNNGWMALPVVASLALRSPPSAIASQPGSSCSGTLFQLAVHEQAVGDVDRFRFSLGLTGEGRTEAAALKQLNQRLAPLRRDLTPLMQGTLTVPAPVPINEGGSGSAASALFVASTTLSGEVGPGALRRFDSAGGRSAWGATPGHDIAGECCVCPGGRAAGCGASTGARTSGGRVGCPQHRPQAGPSFSRSTVAALFVH